MPEDRRLTRLAGHVYKILAFFMLGNPQKRTPNFGQLFVFLTILPSMAMLVFACLKPTNSLLCRSDNLIPLYFKGWA
jgi:hypothetical protein